MRWLVLLFVSLSIYMAMAVDVVELQLCNIVTGEKPDNPVDGVPSTSIWLPPSSVTILAQVPGKECTMLSIGSKQVAVLGSIDSVWCKLHGGPLCLKEGK